MVPIGIIALGHGDKIRPKKDPTDAVQIKDRGSQGRGHGLSGAAKFPGALTQNFAARKELQDVGIGRGFGLNEHAGLICVGRGY